MKVKFYFHPDRDKEVGDAIMRGKLTAYPHQLVASDLIPLQDGDGKALLGYWINEWEASDWTLDSEGKANPALIRSRYAETLANAQKVEL